MAAGGPPLAVTGREWCACLQPQLRSGLLGRAIHLFRFGGAITVNAAGFWFDHRSLLSSRGTDDVGKDSRRRNGSNWCRRGLFEPIASVWSKSTVGQRGAGAQRFLCCLFERAGESIWPEFATVRARCGTNAFWVAATIPGRHPA